MLTTGALAADLEGRIYSTAGTTDSYHSYVDRDVGGAQEVFTVHFGHLAVRN